MPSRYEYNRRFLQELQRLDERQRQAVEHIDGPVLVIAGPGTGKTHILATRIGRILLDTDTQPHNILCLTFTDAAVRSLRNRLVQLLGPEGLRVHVHTFHSFSNRVIQENLEVFGNPHLDTLSDLERLRIIRQLLEELPVDSPLRKGHRTPYFHEPHLVQLFRHMKSENWTPQLVENMARQYLSDIQQGKHQDFIYKRKKGSDGEPVLKTREIEKVQTRMERLIQAAHLFGRYQELLRQTGRYDYDDMILWTLEAFEEQPELLRQYQEQYLYVLVDEYQDTNGAQNQILLKLIDYWDTPNVLIVGDDDQSIYEFQGARLKNLTDFYERYREAISVVVLNRNYRSSQKILDAATHLIQRNTLRVVTRLSLPGLDKKLLAANPDVASAPYPPTVVKYPSRFAEDIDLADTIERLHREGVSLDEVAIIYARHAQAARLTDLLERRSIPYRTRRPIDVLSQPVVKNLRTMLSFFAEERLQPGSADHHLFRMLHFACFGIDSLDRVRLALLLRHAQTQVVSWRLAIADENTLAAAGVHNPQAFLSMAQFIDDIQTHLEELPLPALVERIINRSGLLRTLFPNGQEQDPTALSGSGYTALQALHAFLDFTREETRRNPHFNLTDLLKTIDDMESSKLPLPLPQGAFEKTSGAVNLLTAHSAKGLEFDYVFMLDCTAAWEPATSTSSFRFIYPPTLELTEEEDATEARRRLFYVAMTRARTHLQMSWAELDDKEKTQHPCLFLTEMLEDGLVETREARVEEEALMRGRYDLLQEAPQRDEPLPEAELRALLEGLYLTVTGLDTYLRCPLSFFYEHVLKVPTSLSPEAAFGQAMHRALQRGLSVASDKASPQLPLAEQFVHFFEEEMERVRLAFGKAVYEQYLHRGRTWLTHFVERQEGEWPAHAFVEKTIEVVVNDVPLRGTIDRIDLPDSKTGHIVDYKSGRYDPKKLRPPSPEEPYGGSYWRQLIFYKILFDNWPLNQGRRIASARVEWLDPDARKVSTIEFSNEDISQFQELLRQVWEKIQTGEFNHGCEEPGCPWCTFLLRQLNLDAFYDAEATALDDGN